MSNENKGFKFTKNGVEEFKKPSIIFTPENERQLITSLKLDSLDEFLTNQKDRKYDSPATEVIRDQLTLTIKKAMELWFANFVVRQMFNVNQFGGPGVTKLKYDNKDWSGKARIVGGKTNDAPKISSKLNPNYQNVYNLEIDAEYTMYELEASRLGTEPLDTNILKQTKYAHEWAFNDLVLGISDDPNGDSYPGLLNQQDKLITVDDADSLDDWDFFAHTGDENKDFLMEAIDTPEVFTNQAASAPTKIAAKIEVIKLLMRQTIGTDGKVSVAKYVLENSTIEEFIAVPEFKNIKDSSGADRSDGVKNPMLIYNDNDMIGEVIETVPFMNMPTQQQRTRYIITTRSSHAGLFIYIKAWALIKDCGNPA